MAEKYLKIGSTGLPTEQEAAVTSSGAGDAGKIVALDSNGKFHTSLLPTGIGTPSYVGTAGEALSAGDFVYVDSSGEVRKADASASGASKVAVGFVLEAVSSGNNATVYLEGNNDALSSLTAGTRYFLSASSPGAVTTTAPSTAGHVVQYIGVAINATTIAFDPDIIAIRG